MFLGNLLRFSLRLDILRNLKAISVCFTNEALNISECYCRYHFCFRIRCSLRSVLSGYYNIPTNEWLSLTIFGCLWEACADFRYPWMFCRSVQRFCYPVRMNQSTFWSATAVIHYFCFWTACCQGIKDTLAKFESAVLVDVYHCLCVYRYFSHLLFENEAFNIFEQHSLPVFIEVVILLSRPDCSNSRVSVSTDRSSRPDRIVTIRWNICSFPQQFDFWQ